MQKKKIRKKNNMNKIFEKIKKFIYKYLIRKEKTELLEEAKYTQISKKEENNKFKEDLNAKKYQNILNIQNKYENEEIKEEELSILEIMDLIDIYKEQIKEMKLEIKLKEAKN